MSDASARHEPNVADVFGVLESALEHMDQGISIVDADLRVVAFNGKFLELLDLPGDALARTATELAESGASAVPVEADVSDREAVDAALDAVRAEFGPITIMVLSLIHI